LDGKRVKKQVIEEFLSKNGISLEHVIRQGEVQRIVEMNPKDRRSLIDFVANVSEYESKKKEAISELDKVQSRLGESQAIFGEKEGFLVELEADKKNAEKFVQLEAALKRIRATILTIDVRVLDKQFESLVNAAIDSNNKINALEKSIAEIDGRISEKQKRAGEINKEILSRGQGRELELNKEINALETSIEQARLRIEDKKKDLAACQTELNAILLEKQRAVDEVKGSEQRIRDVSAELKAVEELLKREQADFDALTKQSDSFSSGYQASRQEMEVLQQEMNGVNKNLQDLHVTVETQKKQQSILEAEANRLLAGEFSNWDAQKRALQENLSNISREVRAGEKRVNELFSREKELNAELQKLDDAILEARERVSESEVRLRLAGDSGGKAVEAVIALRERIKGIHGTLQELIGFDAKYSLPISVALGPRLQYVVVDSVKTAGKVIEYLKENRLGRLSFIPLDKIDARPLTRDERALGKENGSVGFLIDLIEFDASFKKAMEYACTNTLVTRDFVSAESLIHQARLVTMAGELIEQSGLVTGGHSSEKVNPFVEMKALREWQEKLEKTKAAKEGVWQELKQLQSVGSEARKAKADAELRLKAGQLEEANVISQEKAELEKKKDVKLTADKLRSEAKTLEEKAASGDDERRELLRKLSGLNTRFLAAKERVDLDREKTLGSRVKEKEHKLSELRIQNSDFSNQLSARQAELNSYSKQLQLVEKQEAALKSRMSDAEKETQEADVLIKKSRLSLKERNEEQKKMSSALRELWEDREMVEQGIKNLGNEKAKFQFELEEKIKPGKQELELKRVAVEERLKNAKAALGEFEGIAIIDGKADEDTKPFLLLEEKKTQDSITELGPINLKAIQEYDRRKKELETQKQRVEQLKLEREAVLNIITEIDGKKISVFMKTFEAINANFQVLFKSVFPGNGTLFLENPENPFDGGLTIRVQLENKEVKYLELMSGGEKSLVALMFLFSIQGVRPSGIYVLDEADAALDQQNSLKLAELLRALSRNTQFIVVTHNEAVFKNADCLVGIAMNGREGSKCVEVKLKEKQAV
jgi:chromosome segregation protein